MRVKLTPAAQRDFAAQVAWLATRSPTAGRRAALAIVEALDLLREFPEAGPSIEVEVRQKTVRFGAYGYVIEYECHPSIIFVTRIYHGAQDRTRD
jgi:plasmid stabilization system protein ParE|tara:strand:- start:156 stop:440 length:285 start_codon:yes stop_codon:yes gene_type:complete